MHGSRLSLYLTYLSPASSPVSASTCVSLTHSRSLDLPASPWAKPCVVPRILPPHLLDSLVRDPCGPAQLLRIREDNLDSVLSHVMNRTYQNCLCSMPRNSAHQVPRSNYEVPILHKGSQSLYENH